VRHFSSPASTRPKPDSWMSLGVSLCALSGVVIDWTGWGHV
jgi:hypothetical protein